MRAARAARMQASEGNVVRLRDRQPVPVPGKTRRVRAPLASAVAFSVLAHAALLYIVRTPVMPSPALPQPIEVVLVQPPVPLPEPRAPAVVPPPEIKPAQPKARQAPPPAARPRVQPPPLLLPSEEPPQIAAPAAPATPEPATPPAVATRDEPATGGTPSPQAARSGAVSSPSFNAAYLRNPPPRYPLIARRNGEQGVVTLRVLVTREGLPGSVVLEKTSGSASLDAAALATVKGWRFVPAQQNGQPVDAPVLVPIVFRLQDAS